MIGEFVIDDKNQPVESKTEQVYETLPKTMQ